MMHRMFMIDELLRAIFLLLSPHELTIAARVHSIWNLCAISVLWKNASHTTLELQNAMEFGPSYSGHVGDGTCKCDGCDLNANKLATFTIWKRFKILAPYIFHIHQTPWLDRALAKFSLMAREDEARYMFPNIRSLRLYHDSAWQYRSEEGFPDLNAMIAPTIEHLCLQSAYYWSFPHLPFIAHVLRLLEQRVPTLRTLHFIVSPPHLMLLVEIIMVQCIDVVKRILEFFAPTLRSIQLPGFFVTEPIIATLGRVKSLCSLDIEGYREYSTQNRIVTPEIRCDGEECQKRRTRFASPCSFVFAGDHLTFGKILSGTIDFTSVTFLKLFGLADHGNIDYIPIIPSIFPQLRTFCLIHNPLLPPLYTFPWTSIQPLLRCKYLTSLRLPSIYVSMNRVELIALLENRTNWSVLEIVTDTAWLRLQDLYLFAKYCPDLVHLGVNIGDFDSSRPDDSTLLDYAFFDLESIAFLHVDIVAGPNSYKAGKLLYRICDKHVYIVSPEDYEFPNFFDYTEMTIAACWIVDEIRYGCQIPEEVTDYVLRAAERNHMLDIVAYMENDRYRGQIRVLDPALYKEKTNQVLDSLSDFFEITVGGYEWDGSDNEYGSDDSEDAMEL